MHPVLVEIPLPTWSFRLTPALLVLAAVLLVVAELGRRSRARDLVGFGVVGALAAFVTALRSHSATVSLGPIPLYGFGVLVSVGLVAGWVLVTRLGNRRGLPHDVISSCYFVTAASGIFGARALYVLTNLRDFHSLRDVIALGNGGLVFYGGVLGGFVGSLLYLRRRKMSWLAWADAGVPSLALGAGLGRMGCYLAGCDYGVPLRPDAPAWLARLGTFPRWPDEIAGPSAGSPAFIDHVMTRGLSLDSTASLPVHPTQLYESCGAFVLFSALLLLSGRRRFRGELFLAFVTGYGALRFCLELLRDDPERGFYGPRGPAFVVVSLGFLVLGLAFSLGAGAVLEGGPSRRAGQALSFLPVVLAWALLRKSPGEVQLSTSQWLALATSVAAAMAWRRLAAKARAGEGPPPPVASESAPPPGPGPGFTAGGLSS